MVGASFEAGEAIPYSLGTPNLIAPRKGMRAVEWVIVTGISSQVLYVDIPIYIYTTTMEFHCLR